MSQDTVIVGGPAHRGGSFAPPFTDEVLAAYKERVEGLPAGPIKDALKMLLAPCEKWWDLPEPEILMTHRHSSGLGNVVPLAASHKEQLDEHIPWAHELDAIQGLFDTIPVEGQMTATAGADVRNMAFHILWHVKELDLGREPITTDKL